MIGSPPPLSPRRLFLPLVLGAMVGGAASCGDDESGTAETSGEVTPIDVGQAGSTPGCSLGFPDGYCVASEDCGCRDCSDQARCTGGCTDDGACSGLEDCSCADCIALQPRCMPEASGCSGDPDGVCSLADSCNCQDCRGDASCACNNNGVCTPATEHCGCSDCAGAEACGGGDGSAQAASSTAASTGGGGSPTGPGGSGPTGGGSDPTTGGGLPGVGGSTAGNGGGLGLVL